MSENASIYGYSDDTIILEGILNTDDFPCTIIPRGNCIVQTVRFLSIITQEHGISL